MIKKENELRNGDLVKYKASFIKSTIKSMGYLNAPREGRIVEVINEKYVVVEWCDQELTMMINVNNIILLGKPDYSGIESERLGNTFSGAV